MKHYDEIADHLENGRIPSAPNQIEIHWAVENLVAVGRTHDGGHAIIITGDRLISVHPEIDHVMKHDIWHTASDKEVVGNLIKLGQGRHFTIATAAIAAELKRQSIQVSTTQRVFTRIEGFITQMISQQSPTIPSMAGLLGELLLLKQLLSCEGYCESTEDPTLVWRGHAHDARDFRCGRHSIEVKTTTLNRRLHTIHSLRQIEPSLDGDHRPTEAVSLLSVGFCPDLQGTYSVRATVDQICAILRVRCSDPTSAVQAFRNRLCDWGPPGQQPFDPDECAGDDIGATRFRLSLEPCLYDLTDTKLQLLRSSDLTQKIVQREGLSYRAEFPERVSHSNPRRGWQAAVSCLRAGEGDDVNG